jgi:hypothetical protein
MEQSKLNLSIEDAVRRAIRSPDDRKAFRERWPMYDADALRREIDKCDADVVTFEDAITKVLKNKRELQALLRECDRRDAALAEMVALADEKSHAGNARP